MLDTFASVLLWHPELSLVPLVAGILLPAIAVRALERLDSIAFAGLAMCIVAVVGCYVGWTALLASIEATSIFDPGAFIVLLGAFGLFALGLLLGFALYWPLVRVNDAEMPAGRRDGQGNLQEPTGELGHLELAHPPVGSPEKQ